MSSTRIFIRRHGRRIAIALLTLSGMCAAHAANVGTDAWSSVDPRIGTGGDGHTFPGATVPFGMITAPAVGLTMRSRPVKSSRASRSRRR